ncbi:hypothetical protein JD844_017914 [Phrynosoma platyrhinos]|uniref:MACPF domain-containing protein n=1 Tax=Phrynosoma platyrhinos TaxID=52577 RepID=A0ABQ7SML1_PHRPL|nr:hypothetical protein JD844_017914 [Phrynosoma platyrhinos]
MCFHLGKIFSPMILLIVYLLSCQDTAAVQSKLTGLPSQRRSRRQTETPAPIDCQLSQWSEWTECFPCQGKKYRYRTLLQPSKYKGHMCTGSYWEKVECEPTTGCTINQDCGTDFKCQASGRCIKRHLVCNGEPDCRDESDEADCEDAESFCDHMDPIPGVARLAQGYNILTQEVADIVYDPTYYGGHCESVYNGDWREEKYDPAYADSGFSTEYFDNARDLLNAVKKDTSWNAGFTVGVGFPEVPITLEVGFKLSKGKGTLRNTTEYASKVSRNLGFIRSRTKVQTARFKMRRNNIFLDEHMLQSLMELPDQYNYGMYANFINTYGTHFMTSGTLGGIFEYILVINKDKMKKAEIKRDAISNCYGGSIGVKIASEIETIETSAKLSYDFCKKEAGQTTDSIAIESVIEDVIPRVQGGDTASIARLMGGSSSSTYHYWGRSLKFNPAIIDFEELKLQPIHEILRRTPLRHMEIKRKNLKRALDEYLMEFNACRCGPCYNNGVPMLIGSRCVCECQNGAKGPACEKTMRTVPLITVATLMVVGVAGVHGLLAKMDLEAVQDSAQIQNHKIVEEHVLAGTHKHQHVNKENDIPYGFDHLDKQVMLRQVISH